MDSIYTSQNRQCEFKTREIVKWVERLGMLNRRCSLYILKGKMLILHERHRCIKMDSVNSVLARHADELQRAMWIQHKKDKRTCLNGQCESITSETNGRVIMGNVNSTQKDMIKTRTKVRAVIPAFITENILFQYPLYGIFFAENASLKTRRMDDSHFFLF